MRYEAKDWRAPSRRPWPTAEGPWLLTLEWGMSEQGMVCTGVHLALMDGQEPRAVTTSLWREVRIHDEIRRAREARLQELGSDFVEAVDGARERGEGGDLEDVPDSVVEAVRAQVAPWKERKPGRPVSLGDDHYREVAQIYSQAIMAGRRDPRKAVAEALHTEPPTVSHWLRAARERGLLPSTAPGRAAGNMDAAAAREVQPR